MGARLTKRTTEELGEKLGKIDGEALFTGIDQKLFGTSTPNDT